MALSVQGFAEAVGAIRTEREFQERLKTEHAWTPEHIAKDILLIEEYAARMRARYAGPASAFELMHDMRKIAAMCVRSMEQHGAPTRDLYDLWSGETGDVTSD